MKFDKKGILVLSLLLLFISLAMTTSNYRNIVSSFRSRNFYPPFLQSNPHYQTIVGSEALRVKYFGPYPRSFETARERFATRDSDFFDVDYTLPIENLLTSKGIVVLVHGLESNAQGPLMTKMCAAYLERGFSCALISFRGCSGEENLTPGAYHLGFTTDLHQFVNVLHSRYPSQKIYLSGFSLGGNVILKLLGELGDKAISLGICGAVAACVPFDPLMSQGKIDKGFNRAVYSKNFLSTLIRKAEKEHEKYPYAFDIERVRKATTMGEFDDAYIANIYNFDGKDDYYRKTGSKWFLSKIRVPAIAINARDDPFIEECSLPTYEDIGDIAPVRLIYHDYGGHCGFIATKESYRLPESSLDDEIRIPLYGWLADEMARVIWHIDTNGDISKAYKPILTKEEIKIKYDIIESKAKIISLISLSPILLYALNRNLCKS